jgi:hypothetical protein
MDDEPDGKNGDVTVPITASAARNRRGQFTSANSGRPKGARNKTTVAVESIMARDAKKIAKKAVELALAGDTVALKLVLDRIAPPVKQRPVTFPFQGLSLNAAALPQLYEMILAQVASGDTTPGEAAEVLKSLEMYRNAEVTANLTAAIAELKLKGGG